MEFKSLFFLFSLVGLVIHLFLDDEDKGRWLFIGYCLMAAILSFLYDQGLLHYVTDWMKKSRDEQVILFREEPQKEQWPPKNPPPVKHNFLP